MSAAAAAATVARRQQQFAPSLHPAHFYPLEEYRNMPHRVHSADAHRNPGSVHYPPPPDYHRGADHSGFSHHPDDAHYPRMASQPTPPPIATLHHSPAMSTSSLASSSISPSPPTSQPPTPYYQHAQAAPMSAPPYPYNPNASMPARYGDPGAPYTTAAHPVSVSTRSIRPSYVPTQPYPGQANYIIHTDDAATKLSDRVRRKCYNCRTTDTSTWRRSSLTPGKVLCNKCGLFERTHSRPRPEQFPHKRGPLVTATFKSARTPPPGSSGGVQRLPPIAAHHMHAMPPHHSNHPSIAPLMPRADGSPHQHPAQIPQPPPPGQGQGQQGYPSASTVPEIRSLLNTPAGHAQESADGTRPPSPEQQQQQQVQAAPESPRGERRDAYRAAN
ncbi:hypothetical protein POSPLADRAFT_1032349 [Postia placenta MAD-698-R-SB12]|uniref:GATA-type domain-containing protein n=1 Tax=Postia placenta MAD-698-R-SB12 TaxID=670580 RepID=A0A1X6N5X0_9APHY|nr:hypothetical protein POSPLADRAFT_1032349 [Postia placenta MAD-698-R-SB12]OSX63803.1 hypothetical protein POSPLADRAFT_1032349 [Postia placenta MAD-698-R-SB12]